VVFALATDDGFAEVQTGPVWSDDSGWDDPSNALTLQLGDVNGDGQLDLCGRANAGIRCVLWADGYTTGSFVGPVWSDDAGWDAPAQYWSLRLADVTGDGRADLCGRAADGIVCAISLGDSFAEPVSAGWGSDTEGYGGDDNWPTLVAGGPKAVGCSDVDGDGVCDDADACPDNPQKTEADACGCDALPCMDDGLPGTAVPLPTTGCGCAKVPYRISWGTVGCLIGLVARRRRAAISGGDAQAPSASLTRQPLPYQATP
jgi:hypothetical protein